MSLEYTKLKIKQTIQNLTGIVTGIFTFLTSSQSEQGRLEDRLLFQMTFIQLLSFRTIMLLIFGGAIILVLTNIVGLIALILGTLGGIMRRVEFDIETSSELRNRFLN